MERRPGWWDRPTTVIGRRRTQRTPIKPSTTNSPRSNQGNSGGRPRTTTNSPRSSQGNSGHRQQHVRGRIRRSPPRSAESERFSNLLIESSLRSDQHIATSQERHDFGQVSVNREWFRRSSLSKSSTRSRDRSFSGSPTSTSISTSTSTTMYRSGAINIEILLKEALAAIENHTKPNPFRTAVAFDALMQIIPQLGGFQRVMRQISLELLASVYPKAPETSSSAFEPKPFFATTILRGEKIHSLNMEMTTLQQRYDSLLATQMASTGSINVIVDRWVKKVKFYTFQHWCCVVSKVLALKNKSAEMMKRVHARKRFADVFYSWRRWVTKLSLERALVDGLVVGEQIAELDRTALLIKELRNELIERNNQISVLKKLVFLESGEGEGSGEIEGTNDGVLIDEVVETAAEVPVPEEPVETVAAEIPVSEEPVVETVEVRVTEENLS